MVAYHYPRHGGGNNKARGAKLSGGKKLAGEDPNQLAKNTIKLLNCDPNFKDALKAQALARKVIVPALALQDFKDFVKQKVPTFD